MSFRIQVTGSAQRAVEAAVPALVRERVASRITAGDATLWGDEAREEASRRLGWTEAVSVSRGLVPEILRVRDRLRAEGVDHIVLGGMGGSSLAPEVITRTARAPLTVLDSTAPSQVRSALDDRLSTTAVVISSKSGSTVETDSQRRVYEKAFTDAGIDPTSRMVFVTDPGSPMDRAARDGGYTVFNADPRVGGRYSALTAFGLVPSALAGADIEALLVEAEGVSVALAADADDNPGLVLGAAMAGAAGSGGNRRDKLGLVADGTPLVGFPDWAEQLIAESTGKHGTGILPVVLPATASELAQRPDDLQVVRFVRDAAEGAREDEITVSGGLGAQFLVWEYAVAIAGRLLGIDPFDQPDVESAKEATRGLLERRPEPAPAAFIAQTIAVRGTAGLLDGVHDLSGAIDSLLARLAPDGYVSVQAYLDRVNLPEVSGIRDVLAERTGRPVTFGWGPRFLHSTGQYHKGGPEQGVFLQLTQTSGADLRIPGIDFTFGELIQAQAEGDAGVLADHGRPVLTLTISDDARTGVRAVLDAAHGPAR